MQAAVNEIPRVSRVFFILIAILSLAGIVVSAISVQRHYAKSDSQFCDFNQQFNCDIVNRSEYSEISGIPVAAIGVAGYVALFCLAAFRRTRSETPNFLLILSLIGLAFALRLTYIEKYELMTWCILCLISQALILLIAIFAAAVKVKSAKA